MIPQNTDDGRLAIRLQLPLPPSVNRLWRIGKGARLYTSKPYARWKIAAGWELKESHTRLAAPIKHYSIIMHVPERMRGDIDNRIKALNDFLKIHGFIVDDRYCREVTAFRADTTGSGRCDVHLFSHDAEPICLN